VWLARSGNETALVALNFSAVPRIVRVDAARHGLRSNRASTLLDSSTASGLPVQINRLELPPYGSFIGLLR
jgi:hypothetical protein